MTYNIMREFRSRFVEPRPEAPNARPWSDMIGHMTTLFHEVAVREDPVIIEMGVRSGESTCSLLAAAVSTGGELWSCDIATPQVPTEWYSLDRWHFIEGDDVSDRVLTWMPKEADVIFIDTSHTYAQTIAELNAYVPRLKNGGIMLLHDTEMEVPLADHPTGEVARALDDFCAQSGKEWENRPGCYGLGVIHG